MPDDADTIRARIGEERARQLETAITDPIQRESELGVYDLEAVKELGRWAR